MAYTKILFQDSPSTATPLNAQNLNHMDDQIALNDQRLTEIETSYVKSFKGRTGDVVPEKGDYDINQIVASDGQEGYIPVWRNNGTEQEPDWVFEMESVSGGGGLGTCNSVDMAFAYVVTPSTDFSITEGLYLSVIFSNNFTYDGVHTLRLSIDGVGYDVKINGQNPTASVIYVKSGDAGIFVFDGTYFQLIGTSGGGHIIWTQDGSNMPQESGLQFADAFLTDDSVNGRTVVENIKEVDPADYASTTDEGIIVTDDGDDALIGPVSDDYVLAEADGTKTWQQLLNSIWSDADKSKITDYAYIYIDGTILGIVYNGSTQCIFTLADVSSQVTASSRIKLSSNSTFEEYSSATYKNNTTGIATTDVRLYYGNKKATVDLQTTANRCLMSDGTTVQNTVGGDIETFTPTAKSGCTITTVHGAYTKKIGHLRYIYIDVTINRTADMPQITIPFAVADIYMDLARMTITKLVDVVIKNSTMYFAFTDATNESARVRASGMVMC